MVEGCGFDVVGGVHPVVANQQQTPFVTNSCNMDTHCLWLITGPNMGGVCMCVYMCVCTCVCVHVCVHMCEWGGGMGWSQYDYTHFNNIMLFLY